MPELPDITAYITASRTAILGQTLERVRLGSASFCCAPSILRSVMSKAEPCVRVRRIGKRIAIGVEGDLWLVLHLMIAGRLHWKPPQAKLAGRNALAAFDFPTVRSPSPRPAASAALRSMSCAAKKALHAIDPGGVEIFSTDLDGFRAALTQENRTLKRALTDPRLISGMGNAYSDEILHAAQLSPITLTHKLKPEEWQRLFAATRSTLTLWMDRLRRGSGEELSREGDRISSRDGRARPLRPALPALRRENPAHPLRRQRNQLLRPLPDRRQSAGRPQPVALLGSDWPRTLDELEALKRR